VDAVGVRKESMGRCESILREAKGREEREVIGWGGGLWRGNLEVGYYLRCK
jgi:hypothetical protein